VALRDPTAADYRCAGELFESRIGRMPSENFTARAARWSARHRRFVLVGWLVFVAVAFAIGSAAGIVLMKDEDFAIGDSRAAEKILADEFTADRAREMVLIQSRDGALERSELEAAAGELATRLEHTPNVASIE
jgi:RND superfamily putative drug exporter